MMTRSMQGGPLFACALLVLGYASPGAIAQGSSKTALVEQAKATLASLLPRLDEVGTDLDRKKAAHQIFSRYVDNSMPEAFVRGLNLEIGVLEQLIKANNLIGERVTAANQLAGGRVPNTRFSEIEEHFSAIDDSLKQLQDALKSRDAARQSFKLRLDQIVKSLIVARPQDTNTLLRVMVELDPKLLDLQLAQQRLVLSAAIISCRFLK